MLGELGPEAPAVDEPGRDAGVLGALEDEAVRVVGEDEHDLRIEGPGADGVEDGLHVGTGAGAENAESEHGGRMDGRSRGSNTESAIGMRKAARVMLWLAESRMETHIPGEMTRTPLLLFTAAMAAFAFSSCETTSPHVAGGGAYDDSQLARKLDSNAAVLDAKDEPSAASYEQWREPE